MITAGRRPGFPAARQNGEGAFSVITGLDHVVVLSRRYRRGRSAAYRTLFARAPSWRNSGDGAERVLFTLDNMTLELMAPAGDGRGRGPHPRRAGGARRGPGEPVFSHQRHRQNAPPARPADPEAGAGRRGRKPRRDLPARAVVEAHPRRDRRDARRPAVLPRAATRSVRSRCEPRRRRSPRWITSWSRRRIPSGPRRSMARGSGSTWRSTARIPTGAG